MTIDRRGFLTVLGGVPTALPMATVALMQVAAAPLVAGWRRYQAVLEARAITRHLTAFCDSVLGKLRIINGDQSWATYRRYWP